LGLTGKNTSLSAAIQDKETHTKERAYVPKTFYNLAIAKDPGGVSRSTYWNPNATGGPILRVVSPFNANKVLFLRIVNWEHGSPEPSPGTWSVTATLDAKNFDNREDDQRMPRDIPDEGLDGIGYIIKIKPDDSIADQTLSSNPNDVFNGKTTETANNREIKTTSGGGVKVHGDGVDILDATGEGIVFANSSVRIDKPIDTTELKETGMLIDSPIKNWIGMPETIITIPAWEKFPDIPKMVAWANVVAFAIQAIDKLARSQKELKKL